MHTPLRRAVAGFTAVGLISNGPLVLGSLALAVARGEGATALFVVATTSLVFAVAGALSCAAGRHSPSMRALLGAVAGLVALLATFVLIWAGLPAPSGALGGDAPGAAFGAGVAFVACGGLMAAPGCALIASWAWNGAHAPVRRPR